MDKSKKKQRYSLRKTQMGVGSVLLATVLLTAGTTRADSVVGPEGGLGLTDGIQGKNGPHIMSLNPNGGGRRNPGDDRKPQVDDEAPRTPRLLDGGTQDGLGDGGKTKVESLAGPDGSGHGGNHLGLTLGLGGGAYIYGNGDRPEVEDPRIHVPEKGNEKEEPKPQEVPEETPTPLPRVAPKAEPKTEKLPKAEPLKSAPQAKPQSSPSGHSNVNSGTTTALVLAYKLEDSDKVEKVKEGQIKTKEELEQAVKETVASNKDKYPYFDRLDRPDGVILLFSKFKANIFIKTVGEDGTSTVSYPFYNEQKFKKEIEDLEKGFADTYDVKREDSKDSEGVTTVTLTLTKKGLKPEVTPQPEKPSTPEVAPKPGDKPSVPSKPEVAPKPGDKPSVPSKPEVAPKPGDKPSVPSIPEMVPEPEKLEMDKSMKVVPGKPKKATPEAQVPEAQVPQVPQVQVPQSQAPQLPSPKEEVAKVQQQPRAIQSSAPAKSGGKQLPNTGEAASILTLVGSGMLGLLGLAFTKKRKTK
ncbi:LPXTG cell wall anchor domain-containing protein [Streptococcus ruminantium]|uniref:LPXTG cell wall anchor domain-containing protein n=1 Tax=Streptococcus ruminantium TaxID=1917441 RepID=UPI0012DE7EBC|nr:LPXTG cell wall anchor domain-containing protein [Streptococcus ruminantium]